MPVTNYIWDTVSDNVLAETDGSHATKAVYATTPSEFGRLISQRRNGQTSHYHYDAIGTTRTLSNSNESVSDTYLDDAWGNEVAQSGTTENPYRFGGQHGYYWDSATGRQEVRERIYEPKRGRWHSKDPLRFADGWNAYLYAGNGPISFADPSGLKCDALSVAVFETSAENFIGVRAPTYDRDFKEFWWKAAGVIGMIGTATCTECKDKPDCRFDQYFRVVSFVENGIAKSTINYKGKVRQIGSRYSDVGLNGEGFNDKDRRCGPCCLGKQPKDPCCCSKTWLYWSYDVPGYHKAEFRVKCDDNKCLAPKISRVGALVLNPRDVGPEDNSRQKKVAQFKFGYSATVKIMFETKFSCKGGTAQPLPGTSQAAAFWSVKASYIFPTDEKGTGNASFSFRAFN